MLNKIFIKIDQTPHPPKSSKFMTKNNNIIELFICDNNLYRKVYYVIIFSHKNPKKLQYWIVHLDIKLSMNKHQ